MKFILLLLFSLNVFADDIFLEGGGLGIESLMGGVGMARLGSSGGLQNNPSLLAFLPKKHEFTSTNQILLYKVRSTEQLRTDVSPDVVPRYAVSSQGFGSWGHAYGFVSNKTKYVAEFQDATSRSTSRSENTTLALTYGMGRKYSENFAWGFSTYLARFTQEATGKVSGDTSGLDYLSTFDSTDQIWNIGGAVGASYVYGPWAFGIGSRFGLIKFGQHANQDVTTVVTTVGTSNEMNHKKERAKIIGVNQIGVQRVIGSARVFLDFVHSPSFKNLSGNKQNHSFSTKVGVEHPLWIPNYSIYSGLAYSGEEKIQNENNTPPHGGIMVGASKRGRHSLNYVGIGYSRPLKESQDSLTNIVFGTKFEY